MIGQKSLLTEINKQVQNGTFPRFSIVVGDTGSEKDEVAEYIANGLGATLVELADCKVDTVRDMIVNAYKVSTLTLYHIKDSDTMSLQAKNSLLKVTEEPPNKAYFVMTLEDMNNTLATIQSRGTVFRLDPYTQTELKQYCTDKGLSNTIADLVLQLADNPGEIDLLCSYNVTDFYSFVCKVVDNVATTSRSNAFKISQSIKIKDTDTGYDMKMFFRTFCVVCLNRRFFKGLMITSKCLSALKIKAVNSGMLFDRWILDIREEWVDGSC